MNGLPSVCFGVFVSMAHNSLTKEIVNQRISHRGIHLIGDYSGNHSKSLFRCSEQHEWLADPNKVMSGTGCPHCAKNSKQKAKDLFFQIAFQKGFKIIGEYNGASEVKMLCKNGHEINMKPSYLRGGSGCFKCSGQHPEIAENIFLAGAAVKGFKVIGRYKGSKTPIEVICKDGHHTLVIPSKISKSTKICRLCPSQPSITAKKKFEAAAIQRGFLISGLYITAKTPTEIICPKGHKTFIQPRFFRDGANCKTCSNNNFDRASKGFFYVYHLKRNGIEGIGFGITNALKQRQKDHRIEFKKTNTLCEILLIMPFENGIKALEIERELKRHPSIINFGVEGFKTECFPIGYRDYVLSKAMGG